MKTFSEFLIEKNIIIPHNTKIIQVTAKDIHRLSKNKHSIENNFIWTYDKNDDGEELSTLSDYYDVNDEIISGKGIDFKVRFYAVGLSDKGKQEFVSGFNSVAPDWYDYEEDTKTSTPWCAPWEYASINDWFNTNYTPEEMGKRWFKKNEKEMKSEMY